MINLMMAAVLASLSMVVASWGAEFPIRSAVYKVTSKICHDPGPGFQGSGLLFDGEYVLTSEHVLLHSTDSGVCHSVSDEKGKKFAAELEAVDWGNGLGLLKLTEASSLPKTSLADLIETAAADGAKVQLVGYPSSQNQLQTEAGELRNTKSVWHLFTLLPYVFETAGPVFYGMSGGIVATADGTKVLSMISHLHIARDKSGIGYVAELWGGKADRVLNIPGNEMLDWVKRVAGARAKYEAAFVRDPAGQMKKSQAVYAGGLKFELVSDPPKKPSDPNQEPQPKPVPEPDPDPVGGPDGVGQFALDKSSSSPPLMLVPEEGSEQPVPVGGNDAALRNQLRIRVTLDKGKHLPTRWGIPERSAWLEEMRTKLANVGSSVEVPYLVRVGPANLEQVKFVSLPEFFYQVAHKPDLEPFGIRLRNGEKLNEKLAKADRIVKDVREQIAAFGDIEFTPETSGLLANLKIFCDSLEADRWRLMTKVEPESLLIEQSEAGWKGLYEIDFPKSVKLQSSVMNMVKFLKKEL